jgi:predicted nucleic acid-binding protein
VTLHRVLADTGPLVAIFSARDLHHEACVVQLREIQPPLLTCWPVLTEAAWLLRRYPSHVQQLLAALDRGFLSLLPLDAAAAAELARFLARYAKMGAQLADAALVHLAERENIHTVFTLDRRDFTVYRTRTNRRLRVVPA